MLSTSASPSSRLRRALADLLADEQGLSTVEYCVTGGVLSAMIFVASQALRDAQAVALEPMIDPAG